MAAYDDLVLSGSPGAYWPFDETTGTNLEELVAGLDATTSGSWSPEALVLGAGIDWNGGYATAPNDSALNPAEISVVTWAVLDSSTDRGLVVKSSSGSLNDGYGWYRVSGGNFRFYINNYNGAGTYCELGIGGGGEFAEGDLVLLVGTYDGTTIRAIVNGTERDSVAYSSSISHSSGSIYFANYPGSSPWGGKLARPAIYPYALTEADALELYELGTAPPPGSNAALEAAVLDLEPDHYWPAYEGTGTPVEVVGGYSTTLYGSLPWTSEDHFGETALEWDGSASNYIGFSEIEDTGDSTWQFAARFDSLDNVMTLVAEGERGYLNFVSGDRLNLQVSYPNFLTPGETLVVDQWYLFHIVKTSDVWQLWATGVPSDTLSDADPLRVSQFGRYNFTGFSMDGQMSHFAHWSRGLSSGEISGLADVFSGDEGGGDVDFGPWEVELEDPDVVFDWSPSVDFEEFVVELEDPDVVFDMTRSASWLYLEVETRSSSEFIIRPKGTRRRTVVVDVDGNSFGSIADAVHGPITWELNRWEEGSFSIPVHDEAAELVTEENIREAQLWRGDKLLMVGPMAKPATDGKVLSVGVHGPAWYLSRRNVGKAERTSYLVNGDFEDGLAGWTPTLSVLQTVYHLPGEQLVPPRTAIVRDPVINGKRALEAENFVTGTENQITQLLEWTVDPSTNPDGDVWTLSGYIYVKSYVAQSFQFDAVVFVRYSTTELEPDPYVQAAQPGAKKNLQASTFRVDEKTPTNLWLPVSIEFTSPPKAGEPEVLSINLRPPVGVVVYDRFRLTRVESTTWYSIDQAEIVAELVEAAQSAEYDKSDVNLSAQWLPTGVKRDLIAVHHEHPNVWNLILGMTTIEGGIDVSVDVTPTKRTLRSHYPAQGQHLPKMTLGLGRNVSSFAWSFEGDTAANSIVVLGTGNGSAREEAAGINPTAFAGGLTLEEIFAVPEGTRIEYLPVIADERAVVMSSPELLTVKTHAHSEILPERNLIGRIGIGDTVPVALHAGSVSIEGIYRIVRMTLNGDDTFDLVLNRRDLHR